ESLQGLSGSKAQHRTVTSHQRSTAEGRRAPAPASSLCKPVRVFSERSSLSAHFSQGRAAFPAGTLQPDKLPPHTTPDMLHEQSPLLSPSLHCLKTLTPGLDLALSSALPASPETPPSLLSTRPGLEKLSAVSLSHFILTQPYSSCLLGFSFTFSLHLHFLSLVYIFLLKSLLPNDMLHYYFQLRKISPFKTLSVHPYMDLDLIAFIHKKHS
uniref:Uncharacterized protein n=1 Tax=Accipiter nisus TaxID=211598 RepID=A0A8B9RW10_9AVES